jgi:hypothetical protein
MLEVVASELDRRKWPVATGISAELDGSSRYSINSLISQCWAPDPCARPTMNEISAEFKSAIKEGTVDEMPKPVNGNGNAVPSSS